MHTSFHFNISLSEKDGTPAEIIAGRGRLREFAELTVMGLGKDCSTDARPNTYEFHLSHVRMGTCNILELVLWDKAACGKLWAVVREAIEAYLQKAFLIENGVDTAHSVTELWDVWDNNSEFIEAYPVLKKRFLAKKSQLMEMPCPQPTS